MQPYYDDGQVTLYCGDCREVLPALADASADLVLTDPPYGVEFRYDGPYQDKEQGYREWMLPVFEEMRRVGRLVMLTTGMRHLWMYPPATWAMCWAKPGSTRASGLGGFSEWEPVLVYGKRRIYNDFKYLPDAANHAKDAAREHPCPKPLVLYRWLVAEGSDPGAVVLDPFAGSGTALRAAKDLGRRAIGIEINPVYCDIIVRRLAQSVLPLEI
jgi:site-specific DNA-methyltransferase (adenine-specific)